MSPVRLAELVSPVFLFVAALRRKIHRGLPVSPGDVRREILRIFDTIEARASEKALSDRWNRAKIALTYLVDEIAIMEKWPGDREWEANPLEIEYLRHNERMRAEWFYDQEYKHAIETGDSELMEVIYLCLCLGFEGKYRGQAVQLRQHADNLFARLPVRHREPNQDQLFPDCYYVDRVSNDPKAPMRIATVAAIFLGIILCYVFVTRWGYDRFLNKLNECVATLEKGVGG